MERQLMPSRKTIFRLLLLIVLLWYFWSYLFPKQLDNSDIVLMKKGHTMDATSFLYVGVKNICKGRPSQYKDFLPKVAATLADTIHGDMYVYIMKYDHEVAYRVNYLAPYRLEEEIPDALLLRELWNGGKEPEFVHWYVPALKSLNTEVPDILHLDDTRVEQVK